MEWLLLHLWDLHPSPPPVGLAVLPGRDAGYPAPPGQIRTCALAHTAPLPGITVGAETHPAVSARTSCATGHPARCPAHVESSQIPRESGPWLLRLRRGSRPLVRRSHSYYGRIRLLHGVHQRRTASTFPLRPPRQELSRGHRGALPGPGVGHTYVPELLARIHRSKLEGAGCRAAGAFGGRAGVRRAVPERGAVAQDRSGALRARARGCARRARACWREPRTRVGAVSERQAGSGSARNRARAAAHWPAQGQRFARCRVQRRAEWVSRPARAK